MVPVSVPVPVSSASACTGACHFQKTGAGAGADVFHFAKTGAGASIGADQF